MQTHSIGRGKDTGSAMLTSFSVELGQETGGFACRFTRVDQVPDGGIEGTVGMEVLHTEDIVHVVVQSTILAGIQAEVPMTRRDRR